MKKSLTPDNYTPETVAAVAAIVSEAEICKNAYFWSPGGSASTRRWNESRHCQPRVEWTEGGHTYAAAYHYRETCSCVYASGEYYRDGVKTTLTAVRNSLKRMQSATASEVSA